MKFDDYLSYFSKGKNKKLLHQCRFGIERETLRLNSHGAIDQSPHPQTLGSPLSHPYISTDYAEAQLEWNTPPLSTLSSAERFLQHLMVFTQKETKNCLFWPYSMPSSLPSQVEIAQYGSSNEARKKEIYRAGLKCRYGQNLQMISGIHFNFSFSKTFWAFIYRLLKPDEDLNAFINCAYLKMIRNYLREGWFLTYLFGATPAADASYFATTPNELKLLLSQTYYGEYATSIRMSHHGYYSRVQNQLAISFNTLENYISDMEYALRTSKTDYQKIPTQLNDHILQIPNEHYSRIRPKCLPNVRESALDAIKNRGIEYLEIRALDIDPYLPLGIGSEKLAFLHLFLLYCFFEKACQFNREAQLSLTCNQNDVALYGRRLDLILKDCKRKRSLKEWGNAILQKLMPIATLLGPTYLNSLNKQRKKLEDPNLTLSGRILEELKEKQQELSTFGLNHAKKHQKVVAKKAIPPSVQAKLDAEIPKSLAKTQALETASEILVPGYEGLELSTQILIRSALKRKIVIEVLDAKESFITLKKGTKIEYVKQATKTSKDSYVTSHILQNKHITKEILNQNGISVPKGSYFNCLEEALTAYPLFSNRKTVVKPKSTNFGLGVFFIFPGEKKGYIFAVEEAFRHGDSILIEEFFEGNEYRFLVIGRQVVGVVKREPAHVIGDGIHSVKQLIYLKNHDPTYYRHPAIHLRFGLEEKKNLRSQHLTSSSIPKKGKKIYLRYNSNVSTGGDAIDVTDNIKPEYKEIALKAAQAVSAKICGVDMIIESPQKIPSPKNHTIIELNYNPVLYFHAFPYKGKKRDVTNPLLDLLGF